MSCWGYPAVLAESQPCAGLEPNALEAIWRAGEIREAGQGERLFAQGEPAARFYVLLSGSVKLVQITKDGSEAIPGLIAPGEMFACVAATGAATYPTSAIAEEPSTAVGWTRARFESLMLRYPRLAENTRNAFGRRLQNARERVLEMSTKTSEQRIAAVLLRLARRRFDRPAEGAELRAPVTVSRQDVAAMSGTGLYTVSRTLQSWSRAGLVEVGRRQVAVIDPDGLTRIYQGDTCAAASRSG